MTEPLRTQDARCDHAPSPASPWILIAGAAAMVALIALHPSIHAHDGAGIAAEMERKAALNRAVHGGLIALMLLVAHALGDFAACLGWRLGRVRAGAIAYGIGVVWLCGAALVSGFVVPSFVADLAERGDAGVASLGPLLHLGWAANQALTHAGVIAWCVAVACWSAALAAHGAFARAVAVLGILIGAVALTTLAGHGHIDVHGMGVIVATQAVWIACVAIWMLRRRSTAR